MLLAVLHVRKVSCGMKGGSNLHPAPLVMMLIPWLWDGTLRLCSVVARLRE